MFLFKVEERYMLTGIGLTLVPGLGDKRARVNDKIKIVRPDNSVLETSIKGISFSGDFAISVGSEFTKGDVPIGSEVWLNKE
jgi:hypothetical protein